MAVEVASLKAVLDLDKRGLDTGLKSASQGLKGFGSSIGGAMAALGAVGAAVGIFSSVTSAIGGMIGAAREAIAVEKDLNATIASTGGVAGVTAAMAKQYAADLSLVTNFQDDAIISGEAMLLTFTRIGKDVFPLATETMLNMAQKFGSIDAAAIQLGKALNDPIKGVTALGRSGIQFSAVQKQQIKDFMAVNDIAGAQGVILGELGTQFGGLAKAAADPFIQLQNAFGEVQEMLGMAIMPMLLEAAKVILPALQAASAGAGPAIGELGLALGKAFGENIVGIIDLFVGLIGSIGTFLDGVNALAKALNISSEGVSGFQLALIPLKVTFTIIGGALSVLGAIFTVLASIITVVAGGWRMLTEAVDRALSVSTAVAPVWNAITAAGRTLWQIIQIIGIAWANLIRVMSTPISMPKPVTPGSPTPMELGLRGIGSAIKAMPPLPSFGAGGMGGMTPIAAGGGGGSSTINITIGNVSASSTTTGDPASEALRMTMQLLRQQLDR
jgi:hypothetical protein